MKKAWESSGNSVTAGALLELLPILGAWREKMEIIQPRTLCTPKA